MPEKISSDFPIGGYYPLEAGMNDDIELLRRYVEHDDESAFTELVQRHVNLVWSTAYRVTRDADLARDVAQTVFAELARKSNRVRPGSVLAACLHRAAFHAAANLVRGNVRRTNRERQAMEFHSPGSGEPASDNAVESVLASLDEALSQLGEKDREAVMLRFFGDKSLAEVGARLGVSDDAAQKRLARALENLRHQFRRRGIGVTNATLAAALGAAASSAAPSGLAAAVAASSLGAAATASASAGWVHVFSSTFKTQIAVMKSKLVVGAIVTAAIVPPLGIQWKHLAELRAENLSLQQQAARLDELRDQNVQLKQRESAALELQRLQRDHADLQKLRGEMDRLNRLRSPAVANLEQSLRLKRAALDQAGAQVAEIERKEHRNKIIDDLKRLGLASRIFATEHGDRLPTTFDEIQSIVGNVRGANAEGENIDLNRYEFITHARPVSESEIEMFVLREKEPRRLPDGSWVRAYGLVDGSVQERASATGSFEDVE